jgi:hypothetical protein
VVEDFVRNLTREQFIALYNERVLEFAIRYGGDRILERVEGEVMSAYYFRRALYHEFQSRF